MSREVTDLIRKLVTESPNRLGNKGAEEIKRHPFFAGFNWDEVRLTEPPWVPKLNSEYDTVNFDNFEEIEPFYPVDSTRRKKKKDPNFPAYTYKKDDDANACLINAIKELEEIKHSAPKTLL